MSTISEDLSVEVHGSNNAWYKAWIIDVFKTNALCTFENGWKPDQRVPFMRIRHKPDYAPTYSYTLNEEVEVKSNTTPCCWWPATINVVSVDRNIFTIVYKYKMNSANYPNYSVDLVGRDRIRPVTRSMIFHPSDFYRYSAEVPEKMRDCADVPGVLDEAAFRHFKEDTGASLIRYDKDNGHIVVLTPHIEVLKDVEVCFEYQLSLLEKIVDHRLRKKRYADRLQSPPTSPEKSPESSQAQFNASPAAPSTKKQYTEEFKIHPNFMGLAIGSRGKNINEARRIPGIIGLDLNEDLCLFKIVGESREAVEQARNKLEYGELVIDVDREIASRIIGRKGTVIQNIVDKSGCVRVRLDNPPLDPDGNDPQITKFMFTGTRVNMKHVKIMINCQIRHAKETKALTEANSVSDTLLRDKIYNKPSPRLAVPLMTPRAPITPPYPNNDQGSDKNGTPVGPEGVTYPTLLQTPTVLAPQDMPRIEHLTIQTQTDPPEVEFVKPNPPAPFRHEPTKQDDGRVTSPRMPLQKRTSYPMRTDNYVPRETYRTSVRDREVPRRIRESPRPVSTSSKPATIKPPPVAPKPVTHKPRVDIKLANEKIGSALSTNNNKAQAKAEDVRHEQQAAIEDLIKAEANKVVKPIIETTETDAQEDKENDHYPTVNNQNVKVDNQKVVENQNTEKNENITSKLEEPILQTIVNEAIVCEFSPSS